jgi:hypothetical protein
LSPVSIPHGKKIMNLPFNDHPELEFMMGKRPELLKLIKKSYYSLLSNWRGWRYFWPIA